MYVLAGEKLVFLFVATPGSRPEDWRGRDLFGISGNGLVG
jgi:hypothetical protein